MNPHPHSLAVSHARHGMHRIVSAAHRQIVRVISAIAAGLQPLAQSPQQPDRRAEAFVQLGELFRRRLHAGQGRALGGLRQGKSGVGSQLNRQEASV